MKCNILNAKLLLVFLFFFSQVLTLKAGDNSTIIASSIFKDTLQIKTSSKLSIKQIKFVEKIKSSHGIKKGWALLILLLTGPLGGHRIYLGTPAYVPLVYTATIGGGFGILPLLDAFAILFTDDLSEFINNDKIIMWIE
jgi:hypothetical protein